MPETPLDKDVLDRRRGLERSAVPGRDDRVDLTDRRDLHHPTGKPVALPDLELHLFADGRLIVKGTEDLARARTLYSRYLGG